jgi:hypothetical protein
VILVEAWIVGVLRVAVRASALLLSDSFGSIARNTHATVQSSNQMEL